MLSSSGDGEEGEDKLQTSEDVGTSQKENGIGFASNNVITNSTEKKVHDEDAEEEEEVEQEEEEEDL